MVCLEGHLGDPKVRLAVAFLVVFFFKKKKNKREKREKVKKKKWWNWILVLARILRFTILYKVGLFQYTYGTWTVIFWLITRFDVLLFDFIVVSIVKSEFLLQRTGWICGLLDVCKGFKDRKVLFSLNTHLSEAYYFFLFLFGALVL